MKRLPVNAQGEKIAEATPMFLSTDFIPYVIAPSPDERYLLLMRPMMPGGLPYILDMKSGQIWPLLEEGSSMPGRFFGWHPDSRRVLFWPSGSELWLIDIETRERTILALVDGAVQGAAISPDGQQVVYVSGLRTGENLYSEAMWMVSTAGSDAHPLFHFGGSAYLFSWSPDGRYLLYMGGPVVEREQTIPEEFASRGPLWLVELDGQNPRPFAGSFIAGFGYEPTWSPDGRWIAFTGLDQGQEFGCFPKNKEAQPEWPGCQFQGTGVYIENIATEEIRRLASGIEPIWSPDGSMLAFLSNQSGATELWTVRMDGTELRRLTTDEQLKTGFAWASTWEVQQ